MNNLRFRHFSVCGSRGETDAFGIVTGKWQVTCGGLQDWVPLPVSLGLSLTNLYVGDFDGDGYTDIAFASNPQYDGEGRLLSWKWRFSHDAAESFVDHEVTTTDSCSYLAPHSFSSSPLVAGVGRFAASSNADILVWGADSDGPNKLCILPSGTGDALMQSRQSMR